MQSDLIAKFPHALVECGFACHVGGLAFADQHHLQFDHSPRYHGRRSEGFEVTHELDHVTCVFHSGICQRQLGMLVAFPDPSGTSEDVSEI